MDSSVAVRPRSFAADLLLRFPIKPHLRAMEILKRISSLADRLRNGLQEINGAKIYSPTNPAMACSIVNYGIAGVKGGEMQDEYWNRKKIRVRSQGDEGVRQSVHFYNNEAEIDATLDLARMLAKGKRG